MQRLLIIACVACAFLVSQRDANADAPVERPNIVIFLVDDLGWCDTSVNFTAEPSPFNRHFRTPNLESLASQGVRFTDAHSCCVCSPSRISLLTGQNASRHGVTNWIRLPNQETSGITARLEAPKDWRRSGLDSHTPTLPRILRDRFGYRTIHVGKAHWGAAGTSASDPRSAGFDVSVGGSSAGHPGSYRAEDNYGGPAAGINAVPDLQAYHGTNMHLTDALTREANLAIAKAVAEKKPFFLQLSHYGVHTPIQPHAHYLANYQNKLYPGTELPIPDVEAQYASMVEGIDHSLGELLSKLNELKISKNTLIFFLSDNGALSHHTRDTTPLGTGRNTHCWPLREGKGSAYEGGSRVPLVISWATVAANAPLQSRLPISTNANCPVPILIEDLFPTLCRLAALDDRIELPQLQDGIDLAPLLAEPVAENDLFESRPLVFHYPHQWTGSVEGGTQPHSAIRLGPWKAIYFYETKRWELYKLDEDLSESHNLAGHHPEQLNKLASELQGLLRQRQATWPILRATRQAEPLRVPEEIEFPGERWAVRTPIQAGLDEDKLRQLARYLGGRGLVTRDGYEVFTWGDASQPADVASAGKPWFTHFLIEAVQSGKLPDFDTPVSIYRPTLGQINPLLDNKDAGITFRHLATQTSCYGVTENPGEAFDYNDYQMALFCDTLFTQVLGVEMADADKAILSPLLTSRIQCQDNPSLLAMGDSDRAGRLRISPRDFCRFGLLYMRGGNWNGQPILEPEYVRFVTHSPLPVTLPRTKAQVAEMLPDQRSLGSTTKPDDQTDHFGSYSWAWWVNGKRKDGALFWPDAPAEVFACLGHKHGKRGMAVIPAWDIVISWNDTALDERPWPDPQHDPHPLNEIFRLIEPIHLQ